MRSSRSDVMRARGSFRRALPALLAIVAVATVASCGGSGAPANTSSGASGLTVTDAWVRPPQGPDRPAGGYLVIRGGAEADALLGAKSDVAGSIEVHESSMDSSGMMGMHPIAAVEVPAGATVELKPGGFHLMFMGVPEGAIEVGKTITLELTFEHAGVVVVQAEVRAG